MTEALTTTTMVKGGTMVTTGSIFADTVIFTDSSYMYLAIVGAIVSMLGVIHEVFGVHTKTYTIMETISEVVKGVALGFLAIPFWYLLITEGILEQLFGYPDMGVSNSLALLVSFGASWYTVPIFDGIANIIARKGHTRR